jgi:hypothetical protein
MRKYDFYYGSQADQFSFVRIPKALLTGKDFQELSLNAKVLYGVLLDRMSLSMKNEWLDDENRVYIIYPIDEIREIMGFSRKKAIDLLAELETFGLLEKKRRGLGLPNILYVKSFLSEGESSCGGDGDAESGNSDAYMQRSAETDTSRTSGIDTSRSSENALLQPERLVHE